MVFEILELALVFAPILVKPNFRRDFILDLDWFTHIRGAILSQKEHMLVRDFPLCKRNFTLWRVSVML
jgi:hypothetical protein